MVAPQRTKSKGKGNSDIVITGYSILTVAGEQAYLNYASLMTNANYSKPSPIYEQQTAFGDYKPVLVSEIESYSQYRDVNRVYQLLEDTLMQLLYEHEPLLSVKRLLIAVSIPATTTERGGFIDTDEWSDMLKSRSAIFQNATIKLIPSDQAAPIELLESITELLTEDEYDSAVYGAADSLLDKITFAEYALNKRLRTSESADGIVLGEAAGFMILQTEDRYLAVMQKYDGAWPYSIAGTVAEIHCYSGGEVKDIEAVNSGLFESIEQVLSKTGKKIDDIGFLYRSLGSEYSSQLQWHKVSQNLWQTKLSEQQRTAIMLGEIEISDNDIQRTTLDFPIYMAVGEIGVASLVSKIIIACAGFEYVQMFSAFDNSAKKPALICDSTDSVRSGAMLLDTHKTDIKRILINPTELAKEAPWPGM